MKDKKEMKCSKEVKEVKEVTTNYAPSTNNKSSYVYMVHPFHIHNISEEELKREYKRYKEEDVGGYFVSISYEVWLKRQKNWCRDKMMDSFISSIHLNMEEAIHFATNNIGDINEAGVYNYVVITKTRTDEAYAFNCGEILAIYKYNREKGVYEGIGEEVSEGIGKNDIKRYATAEILEMVTFAL